MKSLFLLALVCLSCSRDSNQSGPDVYAESASVRVAHTNMPPGYSLVCDSKGFYAVKNSGVVFIPSVDLRSHKDAIEEAWRVYDYAENKFKKDMDSYNQWPNPSHNIERISLVQWNGLFEMED